MRECKCACRGGNRAYSAALSVERQALTQVAYRCSPTGEPAHGTFGVGVSWKVPRAEEGQRLPPMRSRTVSWGAPDVPPNDNCLPEVAGGRFSAPNLKKLKRADLAPRSPSGMVADYCRRCSLRPIQCSPSWGGPPTDAVGTQLSCCRENLTSWTDQCGLCCCPRPPGGAQTRPVSPDRPAFPKLAKVRKHH